MWSSNAFTERLNLKWPILQAPMGSLTTPALAAAVSNAGGIGGLGMWGFSAEDAERRIAGFRQQSSGSLNVNYPLWPEPKITPQASEAMRKRLQPHYDAKGLGVVPQPKGTAGASGQVAHSSVTGTQSGRNSHWPSSFTTPHGSKKGGASAARRSS